MKAEVGKPAPDFELEAHTGEKVKLSDFRGKKVILYFYPKDMTPGCTAEACDFRDAHGRFGELNAVILGVSPDPAKRHRTFSEKYGLPFLLLADVDHQVAELYGVWKLKKMYGREFMGIERSTFVIDEQGVLVREWRRVSVNGHVEDVLRFAAEMA